MNTTILILGLSVTLVMATETWDFTMGSDLLEQAFFTIPLDDGGLLICGIYMLDVSYSIISDEHPGGGDCELMMIGPDGELLWSRDYYSGPWLDLAPAGVETAEGDFVLGGVTTTMPNAQDMWLLKVDADGEVVWNRSYGDEWNQWAFDVTRTSDGGYVLAGYSQDPDTPDNSFVCVVKTDSDGNTEWSRIYDEQGHGKAEAVIETADGILVSGFIEVPQTIPFLLLLDLDGEMIWLNGWTDSPECLVMDMAEHPDGNICLTGFRLTGTGNYEYWVAEADTEGNPVWRETFGGPGSDMSFSVTTCPEGSVVAGFTGSTYHGDDDIWLLCVDRDGNQVWSELHGGAGNESAEEIVRLPDGGYLVTGNSSSWSDGEVDYYVLKVDELGQLNEE